MRKEQKHKVIITAMSQIAAIGKSALLNISSRIVVVLRTRRGGFNERIHILAINTKHFANGQKVPNKTE